MLTMPGQSHRGPLPPLTDTQRELAAQLRRDVEVLALDAAPRTVFHPDRLAVAIGFLDTALVRAGYRVEHQPFDTEGAETVNLVAELPGRESPDEILIVGAHYDHDGPGADDNASGVAGVLAIARALAGARPRRTLRFVLFANEEPPFFQTDLMGSLVYARACKARRENITAMLCLEMIGYYTDRPASQTYPIPGIDRLYPSVGDFIGVVGNWPSRELTRRVVGSFRRQARFPCEGAALPELTPVLGFSDHWAFWQQGYPAVMVTDTSFYRYPYYHTHEDTPDKLDFERMARVVEGLTAVVAELAGIDRS